MCGTYHSGPGLGLRKPEELHSERDRLLKRADKRVDAHGVHKDDGKAWIPTNTPPTLGLVWDFQACLFFPRLIRLTTFFSDENSWLPEQCPCLAVDLRADRFARCGLHFHSRALRVWIWDAVFCRTDKQIESILIFKVSLRSAEYDSCSYECCTLQLQTRNSHVKLFGWTKCRTGPECDKKEAESIPVYIGHDDSSRTAVS